MTYPFEVSEAYRLLHDEAEPVEEETIPARDEFFDCDPSIEARGFGEFTSRNPADAWWGPPR